jgi:hypothetical protein
MENSNNRDVANSSYQHSQSDANNTSVPSARKSSQLSLNYQKYNRINDHYSDKKSESSRAAAS